jgi:hypothetical protein
MGETYGGTEYDEGRTIEKTPDGGSIIVACTQSYGAGNFDVWLIRLTPDPSDIKYADKELIPQSIILMQNYPNPFNPSTLIEFKLNQSTYIKLKLFNILGEEIITLVSAKLPIGTYNYEFDASKLSGGIYFYRLESAGNAITKKMALIR